MAHGLSEEKKLNRGSDRSLVHSILSSFFMNGWDLGFNLMLPIMFWATKITRQSAVVPLTLKALSSKYSLVKSMCIFKRPPAAKNKGLLF